MFICRIFDVHIILRTRTTYNVPVQRIVRQVLVELYSIIYHTNACAMARNSACGNCMHDVGDAQAECMWRCARRDCMNARVRNFRAKFCAKFRAKSDISHPDTLICRSVCSVLRHPMWRNLARFRHIGGNSPSMRHRATWSPLRRQWAEPVLVAITHAELSVPQLKLSPPKNSRIGSVDQESA
eukprot:COSAG03_NODE_430_length_7971_cov_9.753303_6_plen_183_part_00